MILAEVKSRVKSAAAFAVLQCGQLSKGQLADLMHECDDLDVTATGTDLTAVRIVSAAGKAVQEVRME